MIILLKILVLRIGGADMTSFQPPRSFFRKIKKTKPVQILKLLYNVRGGNDVRCIFN